MHRVRAMRALMAFTFLAALLPGCLVGGACTTIGCLDGVDVRWSSASPTDRGTITADGVVMPFDCAASSSRGVSCTGAGVRVQGRPARLQVEVITATGTRTGSFTPQYVQSRPNGPDCDPVCSNATVTVP